MAKTCPDGRRSAGRGTFRGVFVPGWHGRDAAGGLVHSLANGDSCTTNKRSPFIVTNFAGILNVNISVIADAVMVLMDCYEIFTSEIIKFGPLDFDSFIFD